MKLHRKLLKIILIILTFLVSTIWNLIWLPITLAIETRKLFDVMYEPWKDIDQY